MLHSQTRASCSKSAAGLLSCCHQADIRMRSHRLLWLDDNISAASCQQALLQVDCQDFLSTSLMRVKLICENQTCYNLIFVDLLQVVETTYIKLVDKKS